MTDPADRALARSLAETHWRDMMDAAFRGHMAQATGIQQRLDERLQGIAAELPPERSDMFLAAADEERNELFEEYERDPDGLKRRLGATTAHPESMPRQQPSRPSTANIVGNTVVQTAVRATVWETVRAIFRSLRR